MSAPLQRDIAVLEDQGVVLQRHPQPDGWTFLVIASWPLGNHFNRPAADLLVQVPPAYPFAGLDMFWTEPDVRLADGRLPANASLEWWLGQAWLRFSWHPTTWRQGVDNLITYLAFVNRRLTAGG